MIRTLDNMTTLITPYPRIFAVTVEPTPRHIVPGQIWKDEHCHQPNCLRLVLNQTSKSITYQSLATGYISSALREQFGSEEPRYRYVGHLCDIPEPELGNLIRKLTGAFNKHLLNTSAKKATIPENNAQE